MEEENKLYNFRHEDADFCYDSENLRLMKGTARIKLEHKPREVLAHLLKNPKKLVRYKELKTAVWGDTHVEDASIHNAVSKVNVALKRGQRGPDFIRTVPGVGVEILVDVGPVEAAPPPQMYEGAADKGTKEHANSWPNTTPDEIDLSLTMGLVEFDEDIVGFDVLPFGRGLVVCHPDRACVLTDWKLWPQCRYLPLQGADVTSCAISGDGTLLALGESKASASIYDVRNGDKIRTLRRSVTSEELKRFETLGIQENSFDYADVALSPDNGCLAASRRVSSRDEHKVVYPHDIVPMDEPVDVYGLDGQFKYCLAGYGCSPIVRFSRNHVLVGLELDGDSSGEDNFAVYSIDDGHLEYTRRFEGFVRSITMHPDGQNAIVSLAGDDTRAIRLVSLVSGRERAAFSYKAIPDDGRYACTESTCIDWNGDYMASAHNCGVLRLWDVRRRKLLRTWQSNPHGFWVRKLSFCANGEYLFASFKTFPYSMDTNLLGVNRMVELVR